MVKMNLLKKLQKLGKKGKKHKDGKEKVKLTKDDKLFLISLYPKGKGWKSLLKQLKSEKYQYASDGILEGKMKEWVKAMHGAGLVGIMQTEDFGRVVGLSSDGIKYVRKRIKKMAKQDFKMFINIINRLLNVKDEWTIDYFRQQAISLVKQRMDLFVIIFNPKPMERIVSDLKDPFGINLAEGERRRRFEAVIERLEAMGLLNIKYQDDAMILSATNVAREIMSDVLRDDSSSDKSKYKKKYKKKYSKHGKKTAKKLINQTDKIVSLSVVISVIISFITIISTFPIDLGGGGLIVENPLTLYAFSWIPLLVLVFYAVISRAYYYYLDTQK